MRSRGRLVRALSLLPMIVGCATRPLAPEEFRVVSGHAMSAYAVHEECVQVQRGERLEYRFESTEPIHFDIHYQQGGATLQPIAKDGVREDAALYPVQEPRRMCLGWEAGPAGAVIDYRFRVRAARS